MLKQKKKLNFTNQLNFFKKILPKKLIRLRKLYSKSTDSFNIYFKKVLNFFQTKNKLKKIYIRLTQNNIFCTLTNNKFKTLVISSSGKYKIKTSKKKLKYSSAIVLKSFLKEIKPKVLNAKLLISITAPKKLKKKLLNN
jgi:ribosomal protein S11